ncbi:MAG: acetolactate synthase small subunit [Candidatus Auribacterota bacterium]
MQHTLSVLVENKSGVLARVAGLFSGRGFNIQSLTVCQTEDEAMSRMTIVVNGDDAVLEQVSKQLNKLIDVIKVHDLHPNTFVETQLILVNVNCSSKERSEILQIVDIFNGKIVDVTAKSIIFEATGSGEKIESLVNLLSPFGIREMARTGSVALHKGLQ